VFALNPGQVAVHTVIDYTTLEGQRIFRKSTKPLFAESNKFALSEYVDGAWAPAAPTVKVGEGFFLKGAARTYTRNFSVN
jgi:hypothetical protein